MLSLNKIISLLLFFIPFLVQGQSNDLITIDVLRLKYKKYYQETDSFTIAKEISFAQKVFYDNPQVNDEEFSCTLLIFITKEALLSPGLTIDIVKDRSTVQCMYELPWPWFGGIEKSSSMGTIKIISSDNDRIILEESIIVLNKQKNKMLQFKGKKTFYKQQ